MAITSKGPGRAKPCGAMRSPNQRRAGVGKRAMGTGGRMSSGPPSPGFFTPSGMNLKGSFKPQRKGRS